MIYIHFCLGTKLSFFVNHINIGTLPIIIKALNHKLIKHWDLTWSIVPLENVRFNWIYSCTQGHVYIIDYAKKKITKTNQFSKKSFFQSHLKSTKNENSQMPFFIWFSKWNVISFLHISNLTINGLCANFGSWYHLHLTMMDYVWPWTLNNQHLS